MNQDEFQQLLRRVLESAISNTEMRLSRPLPRDVKVELHGCGHSGDIMDIEEAFECLYLDEDTFWGIIDVGVKEVNRSSTTMFVRVSDHSPSSFDKTWNDPPGNGPFKEIQPMHVKFAGE